MATKRNGLFYVILAVPLLWSHCDGERAGQNDPPSLRRLANNPAVNLAMHKAVRVSSSYERGMWGAGHLTNGDASDGWSSDDLLDRDHREWAEVDLGTVLSVDQVVLSPRMDAPHVGWGFPMELAIEGSSDRGNWTELARRSVPAAPQEDQSISIAATRLRYVRVVGLALRPYLASSTTRYRMQLSQLAVFGPSAVSADAGVPDASCDRCKDHCSNGQQDCGETAVDCGGECGVCADVVGLQEGFEDTLSELSSHWQVVDAPGNSITLAAAPTRDGSQSLRMDADGTFGLRIERTLAAPRGGIVSVWFYDDMAPSKGTFIKITDRASGRSMMLGVKTNLSNTSYYYRVGSSPKLGRDALVPRKLGWHRFELVCTPEGAYGKIDGINLSYLPFDDGRPAFDKELKRFDQITVAAVWLPGTAHYDALTIRDIPSLPTNVTDRHLYQLMLYEKTYGADTIDLTDESYWRFEGPYCSSECLKRKHAARTLANEALVAAVLYRYLGGAQRVDVVKERLKQLVAHPPDGPTSCKAFWMAQGIAAWRAGVAAWLMASELDARLVDDVYAIVTGLADEMVGCAPLSRYLDDTKAEENANKTLVFFLASLLRPAAENAAAWRAAGRRFAYHSLTVEADAPYGGYDTTTLHNNYYLENHGWLPHPNYVTAGVIGPLGLSVLLHQRLNLVAPKELHHNIIALPGCGSDPACERVWERHRSFIDFNTFLLRGSSQITDAGGKDDGGFDATWGPAAFSYLDQLQGTSLGARMSRFRYHIRHGLIYFPTRGDVGPIYGKRAKRYTYAMRRFLNSVVASRIATSVVWREPCIAGQ